MSLHILEVWDHEHRLGYIDPLTHEGEALDSGYMKEIRFLCDGQHIFTLQLNQPHSVVQPTDMMKLNIHGYEMLIQMGYSMFKVWKNPRKLFLTIKAIEEQACEHQARVPIY